MMPSPSEPVNCFPEQMIAVYLKAAVGTPLLLSFVKVK